MKTKSIAFKYGAIACFIAFTLMAMGCYHISKDDSSFLLPLCLFVSSVMILSGTLITSFETSVTNILKKGETQHINH
jgi:hypothetical protein